MAIPQPLETTFSNLQVTLNPLIFVKKQQQEVRRQRTASPPSLSPSSSSESTSIATIESPPPPQPSHPRALGRRRAPSSDPHLTDGVVVTHNPLHIKTLPMKLPSLPLTALAEQSHHLYTMQPISEGVSPEVLRQERDFAELFWSGSLAELNFGDHRQSFSSPKHSPRPSTSRIPYSLNEIPTSNVTSMRPETRSDSERLNPRARSQSMGSILDDPLAMASSLASSSTLVEPVRLDFLGSPRKPSPAALDFSQGQAVWRKLHVRGSQPSPRIHHSATVMGSTLYVLGGTDGSTVRGALYSFNLENLTWKSVRTSGSAPPHRYGHTATPLDATHFLVFGGRSKTEYLNDLYLFDTASNVWSRIRTTGDELPAPRAFHSALVWRRDLLVADLRQIEPYLIVIGGETCDGRSTSSVWALSLFRFHWYHLQVSSLTVSTDFKHFGEALFAPRSHHTVNFVGDSMVLCLGGLDRQRRRCKFTAPRPSSIHKVPTLVDVLGHSPTAKTFSTIAVDFPRYSHATVSIGREVLAFGGLSPANKTAASVAQLTRIDVSTCQQHVVAVVGEGTSPVVCPPPLFGHTLVHVQHYSSMLSSPSGQSSFESCLLLWGGASLKTELGSSSGHRSKSSPDLHPDDLELNEHVYILLPAASPAGSSQPGSNSSPKMLALGSSWMLRTSMERPSLAQLATTTRRKGLVLLKTLRSRHACFTLGESIAHGASGIVYKATLDALPVIAKKFVNIPNDDFRSEAAHLLEFTHPNIVKLLGICLRPLVLILEYFPEGDLFSWLLLRGHEMTWPLLLSMAHSTADGLGYLHGRGFIHRDFKSSNLLVASRDPEGITIKLMDFADARYVQPNNMTRRHIGTVRWTAPEVLKGLDYSESADIYGFGIVIWELYTRMVPYDQCTFDSHVEDLILEGTLPDLPPECPGPIRTLFLSCCSPNPHSRPSALDLAEIISELRSGVALGKIQLAPLPFVVPRFPSAEDQLSESQSSSTISGDDDVEE